MQRNDPQYVRRVSHAVRLLRGRWKVEILCAMRSAPARLVELRRLLPFASEKSLTASLEALVADGIIVRRVANRSALGVEYDLSEFLKESLPALLDHLDDWDEFYEIVRSSAGDGVAPMSSGRSIHAS